VGICLGGGGGGGGRADSYEGVITGDCDRLAAMFHRRKLQLYGFLALAGAYFLIAILSDAVQTHLAVFFILYGITFFLSNAGPNTTTFIVPAEAFPIQVGAHIVLLDAVYGLCGVRWSYMWGEVTCGVSALVGGLGRPFSCWGGWLSGYPHCEFDHGSS
jgi:hypothetical protein